MFGTCVTRFGLRAKSKEFIAFKTLLLNIHTHTHTYISNLVRFSKRTTILFEKNRGIYVVYEISSKSIQVIWVILDFKQNYRSRFSRDTAVYIIISCICTRIQVVKKKDQKSRKQQSNRWHYYCWKNSYIFFFVPLKDLIHLNAIILMVIEHSLPNH